MSRFLNAEPEHLTENPAHGDEANNLWLVPGMIAAMQTAAGTHESLLWWRPFLPAAAAALGLILTACSSKDEDRAPVLPRSVETTTSRADELFDRFTRVLDEGVRARTAEVTDVEPIESSFHAIVEELVEASKDRSVRTALLSRLEAAYGTPDRLDQGVTIRRLYVISAIRAIASGEAVPFLERALFEKNLHFVLRDRIAALLADLAPGRAAELFKELLATEPNLEKRASFVALFGAKNLPGAREFLLSTLCDTACEASVRNRAAIDLKRYTGPDVEAAFFAGLATDTDVYVRANCLIGLFEIAPQKIDARLEEFLDRERRAGSEKLAEEIERRIRLRGAK